MLTEYKKHFSFKGSTDEALYHVGSHADMEAKNQPEFMRLVGLKPNSSFLDLACGCLRGTLPLVDYLDEGNFFGIDVDPGIISKAKERSSACKHRCSLQEINSFDLKSYFAPGKKFDFVLSVSLLTHLLPDVIPDLFAGVREMLADRGQWYFTIYPSTGPNFAGGMAVTKYKKEYLTSLGKDAGLKIEDIPGDFPNPYPEPRYIDRVNFPMMGQWVLKAERW